MDLEALALAVDERVRMPAAERGGGRLYAVRCGATEGLERGDDETDGRGAARHDGAEPGAAPASGVVLELLAEGEARRLPQRVDLPAGVHAVALVSGVWAAPIEDDGGASRRPSLHPERRRAHLTVVVAEEGGRDGVDVSVLRYGDGVPTVLRGGVGLIHQRLLRCWSRRPDAPWATTLPPAA